MYEQTNHANLQDIEWKNEMNLKVLSAMREHCNYIHDGIGT